MLEGLDRVYKLQCAVDLPETLRIYRWDNPNRFTYTYDRNREYVLVFDNPIITEADIGKTVYLWISPDADPPWL